MNTIIQSPIEMTEAARRFAGPLNPASCQLPLPAHKLYVETRGSYGAWILHKPRSKTEVLNDSDGEAINLSRTLIQQREAAAMAFVRMDNHMAGDASLGRALRFAASIENASRSLTRPSKLGRRVSALPMASALARLDNAFDRLRSVQIEDGSTCDLIRRYDWHGAFFLCDERGKLGADDDAESLLDELDKASGSVLLIVDTPLERLRQEKSWRQLSLPIQSTDSVWVNF